MDDYPQLSISIATVVHGMTQHLPQFIWSQLLEKFSDFRGYD